MRVVVASSATANAVKERVGSRRGPPPGQRRGVAPPTLRRWAACLLWLAVSGPVAPLQSHAVENEREGSEAVLGEALRRCSVCLGLWASWSTGRRTCSARLGRRGCSQNLSRAHEPGGVGRPIDRGPLAWTTVSGCQARTFAHLRQERAPTLGARPSDRHRERHPRDASPRPICSESRPTSSTPGEQHTLISDGRAALLAGDAEAAEVRFHRMR